MTLLIVNDDNIPPSILLPSFTTSKTADLAYVPSPGLKIRKWPTLRKMIDDKKRLVVFQTSDIKDDKTPWLLTEWDYIWETKWENTDDSAWTCEPNRPGRYSDTNGVKAAEKDGSVPLMNRFLYQRSNGLGILSPFESKVLSHTP